MIDIFTITSCEELIVFIVSICTSFMLPLESVRLINKSSNTILWTLNNIINIPKVTIVGPNFSQQVLGSF